MNGVIDPKELRNFKASEIQIGGWFYVQDENDKKKFHLAKITEFDMRWHPASIRQRTRDLSKAGRLFVRINRPWETFAS